MKYKRNIKELRKLNQKETSCLIMIDNFWTSNIPISGLRHFVMVNQINEKDQIICLMVSVLDVDINLKISYQDLINSANWRKGWVDLPKIKSITKGYIEYKSIKKREEIEKIFINEDSVFNIS